MNRVIPILYEDDQMLAVNKPAGLLVHGPLQGTRVDNRPRDPVIDLSSETVDREGPTLVDWFIKHYIAAQNLPWLDLTRPGIVHRLDRDTSGVMILAKNPEILGALQKQFAERKVKKTYLALVAGSPDWSEKTVRAAVSRGKGTRRRATLLMLPETHAKPAETFFQVLKRFELAESKIWNLEATKNKTRTRAPRFKPQDSWLSLVEAQPLTGRTHQIRVHLNLEGYPILGDPWYQTKLSQALAKDLHVPRLMLHAQKLTINHPLTRQPLTFAAPLPNDIEAILKKLEAKELFPNP